MRNRTKVFIIASLIVSFFIGVVFADPSKMNQFTGSISNLPNKISLAKDVNRVPIAVYDNCKSFIRTDLKTIDTTCNLANFGEKQFKFNIPNELEQALQGSALGFVNTKVYQYDTNDFKIGLFDQVGEKNYTVSLWQLP